LAAFNFEQQLLHRDVVQKPEWCSECSQPDDCGDSLHGGGVFDVEQSLKSETTPPLCCEMLRSSYFEFCDVTRL
jgi:hypothetical protein